MQVTTKVISDRSFYSPQPFVLALSIASLMSCGIGLNGMNPAMAASDPDSLIVPTSPLAQDSNRLGRPMPQRIERAILRDASQRSGVPVGQLRVVQVTPRTFSNPCLFNFGEVCTREYNPIAGWDVVVQVRSQAWVYHVDRSGTQIVLDPKLGASNTQLPTATQNAVLRDAAQRSGQAANSLRITSVTQKTFGNPCEFNFGEVCTREYNPIEGWEAIVQVDRESWRYHISQSDSRIVLDPQVGQTSSSLPMVVRDAILRDAVRRTGLAVSNFQITQVTPQTFGNTCIFDFGEFCTKEYRPIQGWKVLVQFRNQTWTYHADRSGERIAVDSQAGVPTANLPTAIQNRILQEATTWTELPTSAIQILSAEQKTWSNRCVFEFGRVCPMIYQPIEGWEVSLQARDLRWIYHVNRDGSTLLMDQRHTLPAEVANAILQDVVERSSASLDTLRFLQVKERSRRVCSFLINCRNVPTWLTVVSNGRQQWGYQADEQGKNLQRIPVDQVLEAQTNGN